MAARRTAPMLALVTALASATVLAACGGGDDAPPVQGKAGGKPAPDARVVEVEASNFAFDPEVLRATRGEELAIALTSVDSSHDLAVEGLGLVADVGGDETATQRLRIDERGTFEFYCTIPGHRSSGMEGTITVG